MPWPWDIGAHEYMGVVDVPVTIMKTVTDGAGRVWTLSSAGDIFLNGVKDQFARASDLVNVDGVAYHQQYNVAENWWWYDFSQGAWQMRVGLPTPIPTPPTPQPPTPPTTPTPSNVIVVTLPPGRTARVVRNRTNRTYVEIHLNKDDQLKVQP